MGSELELTLLPENGCEHNHMNIQTNKANWYAPMAARKSKGSQAQRPGSLAGLHAARKIHQGQFFTPDDVAAAIWRLVTPAMEQCAAKTHARSSILDTGVGSGRLLQFADPDKHSLAGMDVDQGAIEDLAKCATDAGFFADFITASLEQVRPAGFDVALINPPFSVHLDTPGMVPMSCSTWGDYGRYTAATSHAYALCQALMAADIVVAIVPDSYADQAWTDVPPEGWDRLRARVRLPKSSFREEGTEVATSLLVFGGANEQWTPREITLSTLDAPWPDLDLHLSTRLRGPSPLNTTTMENKGPSITGPVTGNTQVRVIKDGRKLGLRFACALTHAKVLNAVLAGPVATIDGHRYPTGVNFIGQGLLDLQVHLIQDNPIASFAHLLDVIRTAGGDPRPDPAITNYIHRAHRRVLRQLTPFGHVVHGGGPTEGTLTAKARRARPLDPSIWGGPVIKAGEHVDIYRCADGFLLSKDGVEILVDERQAHEEFIISTPSKQGSDGWHTAHGSKSESFPEAAAAALARLKASGGLDVASWDFQVDDAVEMLMNGCGIPAWRMGCGKSRLAIALCLAGGEHNGIIVESRLLPEMATQLREAGISEDLWQIIETEAQCADLKKINLMIYARLRLPIGRSPRRTLARALRRRLSTVCADEAHLLRNRDTAQTRALWQLSPKRRYAMTATPQANQVQDILPLTEWVYGEGTALQPYGRYHPYLEASHIKTLSAARRGLDVFAERHIVTEWVTREWKDGLTQGAKRQVPKVNNVSQLREWAAPLIKRRHEKEPMVAAHFHVPEPTVREIEVEFDDEHLAHYVRVADLFAQWYRDAREKAGEKGNSINLVALLARIGAVVRACNHPQHEGGGALRVAPYLKLTSKQRWILDRLETLSSEGNKTICYVDGPGQADLLAAHLARRGVEAVPFHGKININQRTTDLRTRFCEGSAPVLMASMAVTQNGLNLWQANREVFACRSWTATQEDQAMARTLRPQQTRPVEVEFVHLVGSIDEYQAQMVAMKRDTAGAVVDCLVPEYAGDEFVHMDRMLDRFVTDLAERRGLDPHELRRTLQAA